MRRLPLLLALPLVLLAREGHAQSFGDGYCQQVEGSARSEAAHLMAPTLFGSIGAANIFDNTGINGPVRTLTLRYQAGLEYSLSHLFRGLGVKSQSYAVCRRYRAEQALEAALAAGENLGARAAIQARADYLTQALPQAERLMALLKLDLAQGRATAEEMAIAQLRMDGLRKLSSDSQVELQKLQNRPADPPPLSLPVLLKEYREADAEVEESAGSLRLSDAWDLSIRGGYDQIRGLQSRYPLFGTATLSYNLGHLFQLAPNADAREGRARSLNEDVRSLDRRVAQLESDMKNQHDAEVARLAELELLVADLEQHLQQAETLQTSLVRRYHDYLYFELVRLKSEQVFLKAHSTDAAAFLGLAP